MAKKIASSRLWEPLTVGTMKLQHRVGMCPLTRFRASDTHVPVAVMREYYEQRASVAGTLIISEGTFISAAQSGYPNVPGIHSDEQVAAWREITDAVHAKGSFLVCQLWALGRMSRPDKMAKDGFPILSSSAVPAMSDGVVPEAMTVAQIRQTIADYAHAASCAIRAGFDAVELHGAHGYLLGQFLSPRPTSAPTNTAARLKSALALPSKWRRRCAMRSAPTFPSCTA